MAANGNGTDQVTLSGTAANVLTVATSPATFSADQNTPAHFATVVNTSLADSYSIRAQAPAGWIVAIDTTGMVTVTPAPGTQSGTYPIDVTVQSSTNADLEAQAIVEVTVTSTQPGAVLTVPPDPLLTVPFGGAELPTAFRATVQNLGPTADTYNLSVTNCRAASRSH